MQSSVRLQIKHKFPNITGQNNANVVPIRSQRPRLPWNTAAAISRFTHCTTLTPTATRSQPRSLLSIARLNMARSRVRRSSFNLARIDHTCPGRNGGFGTTPLAPIASYSRQPDAALRLFQAAGRGLEICEEGLFSFMGGRVRSAGVGPFV